MTRSCGSRLEATPNTTVSLIVFDSSAQQTAAQPRARVEILSRRSDGATGAVGRSHERRTAHRRCPAHKIPDIPVIGVVSRFVWHVGRIKRDVRRLVGPASETIWRGCQCPSRGCQRLEERDHRSRNAADAMRAASTDRISYGQRKLEGDRR